MIKIRLAQLSDAPEIKKLNDIFNGANSNTIEEIKIALNENNQEIVCVALEFNGMSENLVGFCCGQIIKSVCYSIPYGDITEFFILEEYQQTDIGKQLVKFIEEEFNKRGVNHLHHITGKDSTEIQKLYHSLGFIDSTKNSYKSQFIVILEKDSVL